MSSLIHVLQQQERPTRRWPLTWLRAVMVALLVTSGVIEVEPASATAVSYYLSYTAEYTAVMTQGPGGTVSHNNIYNQDAYDFDLDGGAVRASAPGTIVGKATNVTGPTTYVSSGNYVLLKHADDTCTRYAHMAHGSITTKAVNDTVGQGELLGNEGNTGSTAGAHLHFHRENCLNIKIPVDFVEDNWTSQNNGTSSSPSSEPSVQAYQSPTTGLASVYARSVNSDLITWWTNSGGWNGPASLGGNIAS